jgi:hypothetical protein
MWGVVAVPLNSQAGPRGLHCEAAVAAVLGLVGRDVADGILAAHLLTDGAEDGIKRRDEADIEVAPPVG